MNGFKTSHCQQAPKHLKSVFQHQEKLLQIPTVIHIHSNTSHVTHGKRARFQPVNVCMDLHLMRLHFAFDPKLHQES